MPQTQNSAAPAEGRVPQALLAVDSPTVALFARSLLERKGFAVRPAGSDGTLPAGADFDLAVVDGAARGAAAIAAACAGQAIPLLAIGAFPLAGAAAEVTTPINPRAFDSAVQHCLERGKAQMMAAGGIDADALFMLWGATDSPGLLSVASLFITELEDRLNLIETLLAAGDRGKLELHAHSIKGASANVGAAAVNAAALKLEQHAPTADAGELAALAGALRAAAGPAIACLQALIRGSRG